MSDLLKRLYEHHRWAGLRLLDFCAGLDEPALAAAAPGTYGSILDTWKHLAGAERRYMQAINGEPRGTPLEQSITSLAEVRVELEKSGAELIAALGRVTEADTFEASYEGRTWTMSKMVPLLQAIDHGREHRTNITTILQASGIEAPQIDLWAYSETLG